MDAAPLASHWSHVKSNFLRANKCVGQCEVFLLNVFVWNLKIEVSSKLYGFKISACQIIQDIWIGADADLYFNFLKSTVKPTSLTFCQGFELLSQAIIPQCNREYLKALTALYSCRLFPHLQGNRYKHHVWMTPAATWMVWGILKLLQQCPRPHSSDLRLTQVQISSLELLYMYILDPSGGAAGRLLVYVTPERIAGLRDGCKSQQPCQYLF